MKRLTLVRHAKSSWNQLGLKDSERPLSERGQRDAPAMGARLAGRGAPPSLIIASSAVRAQATARLIATAFGYSQDAVSVEPALYLASPEQLLEVVAAQHDAHPHLLVVAHNPGLTDLVNQLLPELALPNVPTTGVIALEYPIERWADVFGAKPELAYFDYPKNPELMIAED